MNRVVSIALLLAAGGCSHKIQHGLDEAQANEVETVLSAAGVGAKKVRESGRDAKWAIEVPDDQTTSAVRILSETGLPRRAEPGLAEVYGNPGMVPTAAEERARFLLALSGEISRTLNGIPGVVHARVHLVMPPSGPHLALQSQVKATASVFLRARPGFRSQLMDMRLDIQDLVAGASENLAAEHVSLLIAELPAPPDVSGAPQGAIGPLRVALGITAAMVTVLALALVFAGLRLRGMRVAQLDISSTRPATAASPARAPARPPAAKAA